ncbi:hypothetical protein, partial [Escherichia coli]|uniref:hypothetical protein n=1 Tax=Escherichia coli TaxID=562 RepID=UPI003F4CD687
LAYHPTHLLVQRFVFGHIAHCHHSVALNRQLKSFVGWIQKRSPACSSPGFVWKIRRLVVYRDDCAFVFGADPVLNLFGVQH